MGSHPSQIRGHGSFPRAAFAARNVILMETLRGKDGRAGLLASFLNGLIGVCNCWLLPLLTIGIPKTSPLTFHALALTLAISAALSSALTTTLSAAARSHAFADWPLAKRPCSIIHWCHNSIFLRFD